MDKFSLLYIWFVRLVMIWLPDYPPIMRLRGALYSLVFDECGKNLQVAADVKIMGANRLKFGNDIYLATGVTILARDQISIGSEVLVGVNSVLVSGNHTFDASRLSYRFGKPKCRPISVGQGSWIASGVTVTAGTVIGSGVLIGPASSTHGTYRDGIIYFAPKLVEKADSDGR